MPPDDVRNMMYHNQIIFHFSSVTIIVLVSYRKRVLWFVLEVVGDFAFPVRRNTFLILFLSFGLDLM
jgi:hypothetical protein